MTMSVRLIVMVTACVGALRATAQPLASAKLLLRQRVTLAWQDQELGAALSRLSETQNLKIWIDRRVDISARMNLAADKQTVAAVLDSLAAQQQSAVTMFRGVVYFGPPRTAAVLPRLSSQARALVAKLPPPVREKWIVLSAWECPRLSQPRDLIERLVRDAGAELNGGERIPHDLWPAKIMPRMSRIDRMVLLLANFDLICDISADGRRVSLKPIDYGLATAPGSRKSIDGRTAPQELPARSNLRDEQRYSLKLVDQPLGAVMDQLAERLELQIEWEAAPNPRSNYDREKLVSCNVHEVNLKELLATLLTPAGLHAELKGKALNIRRKSANSE